MYEHLGAKDYRRGCSYEFPTEQRIIHLGPHSGDRLNARRVDGVYRHELVLGLVGAAAVPGKKGRRERTGRQGGRGWGDEQGGGRVY